MNRLLGCFRKCRCSIVQRAAGFFFFFAKGMILLQALTLATTAFILILGLLSTGRGNKLATWRFKLRRSAATPNCSRMVTRRVQDSFNWTLWQGGNRRCHCFVPLNSLIEIKLRHPFQTLLTVPPSICFRFKSSPKPTFLCAGTVEQDWQRPRHSVTRFHFCDHDSSFHSKLTVPSLSSKRCTSLVSPVLFFGSKLPKAAGQKKKKASSLVLLSQMLRKQENWKGTFPWSTLGIGNSIRFNHHFCYEVSGSATSVMSCGSALLSRQGVLVGIHICFLQDTVVQ